MYSKKQFRALEAMCRKQAALARNEMEYSLMEYWLAEAEEWKQFRQVETGAVDCIALRGDRVRFPRCCLPEPVPDR
jgi:hypothetical protein